MAKGQPPKRSSGGGLAFASLCGTLHRVLRPSTTFNPYLRNSTARAMPQPIPRGNPMAILKHPPKQVSVYSSAAPSQLDVFTASLVLRRPWSRPLSLRQPATSRKGGLSRWQRMMMNAFSHLQFTRSKGQCGGVPSLWCFPRSQ